MFVPEEPVAKTYSPGAIKASMWFMITICAGSWALFSFVASEDGPWPTLALPLMMTGFLIYGFYRNRNLWKQSDNNLTTPERPAPMIKDDLFSPRLVTVVAIVMGVVGIGGAIIAFLYDSDNGLVFEAILLAIGLSSLGLGAMIARRRH